MDAAKAKGFTLIELLIVVAIIAILAAIAVPNFLEAQTRAKVARVRTDLRSLATALEAYRTDANSYPPTAETPDRFRGTPYSGIGGGYFAYAARLTTPVAYISSPAKDMFDPRGTTLGYGWDFYEYWSEPTCGFDIIDFTAGSASAAMWVLWSWGPNRDPDNFNLALNTTYDPTNGTISIGNIHRFGP